MLKEYVSCDDGEAVTWSRARDFIWGSRWPEPLVMIDRTARRSSQGRSKMPMASALTQERVPAVRTLDRTIADSTT